MQKTKKILTIIFLLVTFVFNTLYAIEKLSSSSKEKKVKKTGSKIIIGAVENIKIEPPGITLPARIDTGAKTTSIDARDITAFERDGKKWVKFTIYNGVEKHEIQRPVFDTVLIKRHGGESQRRYMIKMRVSANDVSQLIRVSLTDRSSYEYPILIGRNFLKDYFIVDVSKKNLLEKYKKDEKK
jgi:hypothetical protein